MANMTVLDPDTNQTHTCYLVNGQQEFMLVNATITGEEEITMEVSIFISYIYAMQEKSRISLGAPCNLGRANCGGWAGVIKEERIDHVFYHVSTNVRTTFALESYTRRFHCCKLLLCRCLVMSLTHYHNIVW